MPHCSRLPGIPPTRLHITHAEQAGQAQGGESTLSLFISRWKIEACKDLIKNKKYLNSNNNSNHLEDRLFFWEKNKKGNTSNLFGLKFGNLEEYTPVLSPGVSLGFWQVNSLLVKEKTSMGTRKTLIMNKCKHDDKTHVRLKLNRIHF